MDIKKVSLSLVKYTITKCEISSPNLPNNYKASPSIVSEMSIENDYENYVFPFFKISMQLPANILRAIKKSPLDIHIALTITAGYYDDIVDEGAAKPKSTSTFINDKFFAFIDKQDRSLLDSTIEDYERDEKYDYTSTDNNSAQLTTFSLYKEDDLIKSQLRINQVLSNVLSIEALTFIFNVAKLNNILISPPTNYTRYNQFIITPLSVMEQIDRICNDYALHKNGTLIYFGLDRKYIIEFDNKCTAYSTNEFPLTYLYYPGKSAQNLALSAGCAKNTSEKTNYILLQAGNAKFSNLSLAAKWGYASDVNVIDNVTGNVNINNSESGSYAVRTGGADNTSMIKKKISSFTKTAELGLRNVDLSMLTPNKQFNITIDDAKYKAYNGNYILLKCSTTFVKEGNMFVPITMCDFRS